MGRHAALVDEDRSTAVRTVGPVTDPRLFDRPLPARPTLAPAARPASGRAAESRPRPVAAARSFPAEEPLVEAPSPAAPFAPVSVRVARPAGAERVVPDVASTSLLGLARTDQRPVRPQAQRYARTGPVTVVTDDVIEEESAKAPAAFTRKRETALAVAALAVVVGAMSGAAALLPSNSDNAQAAAKADPITAPMPTASTSTSSGVFCLSPQQLKRAMRHHHHHRSARSTTAAVAPAARPSSASSTPTAAPSADATPATSRPSSSAAPSTSAPSNSASPSSAAPRPSGAIPTIVGALPAIPAALTGGTYTLRDFAVQSSGALISGGTLKGAGIGRTVVEMAPMTSTKAGMVPGNGNNQGGLANPVNPLYLLRGVSHLEDVTVQGTQQGHLYNGLYMTGADLRIKDVEINDIPGNSNANPGETFAVGINRASGSASVKNLTINGGTGALASSAGLAVNNSTADFEIDDLTTRDLKYSAGIALWQVRGTYNVRNYVQSGGARALGAERMAGTVNLYDPKWSAGTTGHDVTYTWDGGYSGGRINFYYSSASQVPNRKINVITNKAAGIAGSIHVYIGGVEQQASKYVTVN